MLTGIDESCAICVRFDGGYVPVNTKAIYNQSECRPCVFSGRSRSQFQNNVNQQVRSKVTHLL